MLKILLIKISLISIFLAIFIYGYYNRLNIDLSKTQKHNSNLCKNADNNNLNDVKKTEFKNKYTIEKINNFINHEYFCNLDNDINSYLKATRYLIDELDIDINSYKNNKLNYLDKKYDFMCFWDCSNPNNNMKPILKKLTNENYLNCVIVLINNTLNNEPNFENISLLIHCIKLEDSLEYFNLCRFILIDELISENEYNNLKLLFSIIGSYYNLPLIIDKSIQNQIPNIIDHFNLNFFTDETFEQDFILFQKNFTKTIN